MRFVQVGQRYINLAYVALVECEGGQVKVHLAIPHATLVPGSYNQGVSPPGASDHHIEYLTSAEAAFFVAALEAERETKLTAKEFTELQLSAALAFKRSGATWTQVGELLGCSWNRAHTEVTKLDPSLVGSGSNKIKDGLTEEEQDELMEDVLQQQAEASIKEDEKERAANIRKAEKKGWQFQPGIGYVNPQGTIMLDDIGREL